MSSGDEASVLDGKAGMGTDFDNYHSADDRNSSNELAAPSEDDGLVEIELIDHHPEGSKVLLTYWEPLSRKLLPEAK